VRLALAPAARVPVAYAEAKVPAAAVGGPEEQSVETAAEETTEAYAYQPPQQADLFAEAAPAPAPVEVPVSAAAAATVPAVSGVQFAAAVQSLVETPTPIRVSAPVASAPIPTFEPKKSVKKRVKGAGRFVVQIGAYRNAVQVEKAWAQAQRRYRFGDSEPLSTRISIPGKGTFHRLAIAGFDTPVEATQVCRSIRAKQGVCFVRATAGDAPVQWASRYSGRKA
jgi:hypothetical protein